MPRTTRAVFHPLLTPPFCADVEGRGAAWRITGGVARSSYLLQDLRLTISEGGDGRRKIDFEKPSGVDRGTNSVEVASRLHIGHGAVSLP